MQTFRKIALYFSFKEDESNGNGYTVENTISKHKESAKSGVHNKWTFTHIQCIVYITSMWIIWADFCFWIAESCVQMNVIFHKTCAHTRIHILHTKKKKSYYLHEQQQSIMNSVAIFVFVYSFALFIRAAHFKTRLPSVWQELTNWEKRMKKATTNRMRWAVKNHCNSSISSCAPYKHTGEHKTKQNKRINIYKIYVKTM